MRIDTHRIAKIAGPWDQKTGEFVPRKEYDRSTGQRIPPSSAPKAKLRPFTKREFDAYSGVETKNPMIAEVPFDNEGGATEEGTLIVDGEHVEIYTDQFNQAGMTRWWFVAGNPTVAKSLAEALLDRGTLSPNLLRKLSFQEERV